MAIMEMDRFTLYGFHTERKAVLETLHKMELAEITKTDTDALGLSRAETAKQLSGFESYLSSTQQALEILNRHCPRKSGMFDKRKELSEQDYSMKPEEANERIQIVYEILRMEKQIAENQDSITKIRQKQAALAPYLSLDVPMQFVETVSTRAKTGTLEGMWTSSQIWDKLREQELSACYFEILQSTKQQTCLWILYPKAQETKFREFFRVINLQEPSFSLSHHTPQKKVAVLEEAAADLEQKIADCEQNIKKLDEKRELLELFYDHLILRKEKYQVLAEIGVTENTFMIEGYLPRAHAANFKRELEQKFRIYLEIEPPSEDEEVPVQFKNGPLVEPVESVTADYSMPSKNDIDPNPIMAFFYYFFFGMMFSDAGYGLLMMIACGILGFSNLLERKKRSMFRMFFFCGVSTTFWGLMYGSFFGDMIATVSKTFGSGQLALKPILMDPVAKPLELLILSVAFGLVHILFGLGIKFYMLWRQGDRAGAIFDVGFWILVLSGAAVLSVGMGIGVDLVFNIGIGMMIAGAAGLVLTQGRDKKNIFAKFFGGVLSLYDITSYVGDILSYSRLMALGLATGVIASVVNVLGSLGGKSVVGLISYILISIFGHTLNFAINMLGAYVHTNRLQYVEFYQKFYEGGGKKFEPFVMDTKYYRIKTNH